MSQNACLAEVVSAHQGTTEHTEEELSGLEREAE